MIDRINIINEKILSTVLNTNFSIVEDDSLFTGKLGVALYLLSLHKMNNNVKLEYKLKEILDQIFTDLTLLNTKLLRNPSIYDGLAGLGYLLYCLKQNNLVESEFEEQIEVINLLLIDHVNKMLDESFYDFFFGAVGILHYLDLIREDKLCKCIIKRLFEIGNQNNFIYYNITGDTYSEGLNFGFAHGSSALAVVMLNLYERGICKDLTEQISKGIINNMIKFRKDNLNFDKITLIDTLPTSYRSAFPYNVIANNLIIDCNDAGNSMHNMLHYSGRLGWCNSDLDVMYVLFRAEKLFHETDYKNIALEITNETVNRLKESDSKVRDSFICHGAGGVSMLYRKLYQISKDTRFDIAHQIWVEKTITYLESEFKEYGHIPEIFQLLTGFLGPSLVLKSYVYNINFKEFESLFLSNYEDE